MGNANAANILAGISGSGTTGVELAYFAPQDTTGPVAVSYTAEVQTITISGTPTGGTFTLTWHGISLAPQANNVATTALATAMNASWSLYLLGGTIGVAGTAGTSYVVTFPSVLGNVPTISAVGSFTGGTSPAIAVAETTPGVGSSLASASIPAGFKSAGWVTSDGLNVTPNESVTSITPYGSFVPVRTLITQSQRDFDVTFLETNQVSIAIYSRAPIGTIVVASDGSFTNTIGTAVNTTYAGIFDMTDGINHIRKYCPRLQVSKLGASSSKAGQPITYPTTLTAIPDATGVAIYEYFAVGALAGTGTG